MPKIIFDSSTLISLGSCCLYNTLIQMKELNPDIHFIIPRGVVDEVIKIGDRVIKFAWNASRIQRLVNNQVLEIIEIKDKSLYDDLENNINSIIKSDYGNIELLQKGELEGIILAKEQNADFLAIDEIITRIFIENPNELKTITEKRYKSRIYVDYNKLNQYHEKVAGLKIIRSVDLMAYAYEKGLFSEYSHQNILKALLYSLKYNGCATTFEEIEKYLQKRGVQNEKI